MPAYVIRFVSRLGAVLRRRTVVADDDAHAIKLATAYREAGLTTEIWHKDKLVHEFPPSAPPA